MLHFCLLIERMNILCYRTAFLDLSALGIRAILHISIFSDDLIFISKHLVSCVLNMSRYNDFTPVLHAQETFTQESFKDFHEALLTSV